jgi:ribosome-binding protein aMBF1 (putative translation factor)
LKTTHKRTPRKKTSVKAKTKDTMRIIDNMLGKGDELRKLVERAELNARLAQMICEARTSAGLTQRQLANRIGSTQSVIRKLEDADYGRHSLPMLQRIATALDKQIDIRFIPNPDA